MYITVFAGAPCAKTVSFFRNLSTFLPRPAESRNNFTSKAGPLEFAFLGERGTLRDTRLAADDTMAQNSMEPDPADCTILNSPGRSAQHPKPEAEFQQILRIQGIGVTPSGSGELSATTSKLLIPQRSANSPSRQGHSGRIGQLETTRPISVVVSIGRCNTLLKSAGGGLIS